MPDSHDCDDACSAAELPCFSRRQFVAAGSASAAVLLLGQVFPGRVRADDVAQPVEVTALPRVAIGSLSKLNTGEPVDFSYPEDALNSNAMLVKLGQRAGGGIGPDEDIVAFNKICTHMGGDVAYNHDHRVAGPCPEHLTTFDLTRHGMVVAGHATAPLPQIVLELEDDQIFASGVLNLIFGHYENNRNATA